MPGWNGAGVFVLPYSFVAEAASGVKILASHQDTQWNAVKTGLENCQTRDGQNSPSTDINWGGHKITNLAAPTGANDATNKTYVDATQASEWTLESYAVAYNSANTFRVTGADLRTKYVPGRRLKILHTNGTVTAYATVTLSTYSVGITTVTVSIDEVWALGALFPTVTAVYVSLLTPGTDSLFRSFLPPLSFVAAIAPSTVFGVTAAMAKPDLFGYLDNNEDFADYPTNRLTFRNSGRYLVSAMATWTVTTAGVAHIAVKYSGSAWLESSVYLPVNANPQTLTVPSTVMMFDAGDYLEMYVGGVAGDLWGDNFIRYTGLNVAGMA